MRIRPVLLVSLILLAWAGMVAGQTTPPAPAPPAPAPAPPASNVQTSAEGITFHGFINATAFLQNQNFTFGNGQNAEFPVPPETKTDRWFLDGDVRNTRLTIGFNGPKIDDNTKVGGTIEGDFFGGFNGTGGFSNAQLVPRLRLAYVDLIRGKTTYRVGQAWSPLFGNVASSYSHIAFPLGYGSVGDVGWRFPGVFIYHDMTPAGGTVNTKFTLGVFRNVWNGPGGSVTDAQNAGAASTLPQVEARMDWSTKKWSTYVVGHVDKKDLSGAGAEASTKDSLTGWAAEVGAKLTPGPVTLQGNLYTGKGIGQQFGQMAQFGDISSTGGWLQAGYSFTKRWSGYIFAGMESANKDDVIAAKQPRLKNSMIVPSLMYTAGAFGFNVEWLHDQLTTVASTGVQTKTNGDQLALSLIYKF